MRRLDSATGYLVGYVIHVYRSDSATEYLVGRAMDGLGSDSAAGYLVGCAMEVLAMAIGDANYSNTGLRLEELRAVVSRGLHIQPAVQLGS